MSILKALTRHDILIDPDVNLTDIANLTEGMTGADLQAVLYTAQINAFEAQMVSDYHFFILFYFFFLARGSYGLCRIPHLPRHIVFYHLSKKMFRKDLLSVKIKFILFIFFPY